MILVEIYHSPYQAGVFDDDEPIACPMIEHVPRVGEYLSLYLKEHKGHTYFRVDMIEHMIDCLGKYPDQKISIWVTKVGGA